MTQATQSSHLRPLLDNRSGTTDAQIVFVDIVNYSKRKSTAQRRVIEQFQKDVGHAITEVGKQYLAYTQNNNVNLALDVVKIPTGDGAAIAFTFDGIQAIALDFSKAFIDLTGSATNADECSKFSENNWCNCHPYYSVRVGVNEGKVILFVDMNGQVNVAGTTINDAARVMGFAGANQILLSSVAYSSLIDMTTDITLEEQFRDLGDIIVKHDKSIRMYQYLGNGDQHINANVPDQAIINSRFQSIAGKMGFPPTRDPSALLDYSEKMEDLMGQLTSTMGIRLGSLAPVIDQKSKKD